MRTHALPRLLVLTTWLCLGAAPEKAHPPMDATAQLAARTAGALNCLGYLALGMPGLEDVRAKEGDAALSRRRAEDAGLVLRLTEGKDWVPPDAARARAALQQLQALAPRVRWGEATSVAEATRLAREALTGLGLWGPEGEAAPRPREAGARPSGDVGPTR